MSPPLSALGVRGITRVVRIRRDELESKIRRVRLEGPETVARVGCDSEQLLNPIKWGYPAPSEHVF
jgi:hypothetical protein